jgi:N-dimethylarginine dimethylaminohydrolase
MISVTSEYGKLRKVLLCRPDYYHWQPINETAKKTINERQSFTIEDAKKQHQEFTEAFESTGVEVLFLEPSKRLPYQQYTRDIGVTTRKGVLIGRYRMPVRRGETNSAEEFFIQHGIPVWSSVSKGAIEGGDIHYLDDETAACGRGARSNEEGIREARRIMKEGLNLDLITVEFAEKFLHLDEIFVMVAERLCLAYSEALPNSFLNVLKAKKIEIIEVTEEEVMELKCNVVTIDDRTVMSFKGNINTNNKLEALGFTVLKPDISIFIPPATRQSVRVKGEYY